MIHGNHELDLNFVLRWHSHDSIFKPFLHWNSTLLSAGNDYIWLCFYTILAIQCKRFCSFHRNRIYQRRLFTKYLFLRLCVSFILWIDRNSQLVKAFTALSVHSFISNELAWKRFGKLNCRINALIVFVFSNDKALFLLHLHVSFAYACLPSAQPKWLSAKIFRFIRRENVCEVKSKLSKQSKRTSLKSRSIIGHYQTNDTAYVSQIHLDV